MGLIVGSTVGLFAQYRWRWCMLLPWKAGVGTCFFILFILLIPASPALARWPDPAPIVRLTFQVQQTVANGIDWQGAGKDLIGLEVGQKITPEVLTQALTRFEPFGKAEARVSPTGQGVALTVDLIPHKRIKTLRIENVYPLFENEVRSVMTIAPGDVFDPEVLPVQADLVTRLYQREGYIDPHVHITWQEDEDDGYILVDVVIDKGPAFESIVADIFGNQAFSDHELEQKIIRGRWFRGLFGGQRFSEEQLKEEIDALVGFYRQEGFADVRIDSRVGRDAQNRRLQVRIDIDEGPRYTIELEGNQFFSNRTLQKDLVLFESGNQGNVGLRRSVQNIRRRYLQAGFADVKVRRQDISEENSEVRERPVQDQEQNHQPDPKHQAGPKHQVDLNHQGGLNQKIIRIEIDEGLRHIVKTVHISGNAHLSDDTLKAQMLTRPPRGFDEGAYVAQVLQEDLDAIQALYYQQGFLQTRLEHEVGIDPQSKEVSIAITVNEGVQTRVGDISFSGRSPFSEKEMRAAIQMKPNQAFQPYRVEDDQNLLSTRISPLGYPHVQVRGKVTYAEDRTRADVDFWIEPGPLVEVGKIFFAGNFRTRPKIMRRELGFEQGDPFSLDRVLTAQRNLRDLDLFESVQVKTIGLKERDHKVHLLFETPEKRPYSFELGGGYTTDKGVYGRTRLADHNFRGTNKDIWVGGEMGQTGYRWETGITDPRLWGSRISANLALFAEHREEFNQEFGTDSRGSTLTFSRKWGRYLSTSLGLRYEHRMQFLRDSDTVPDDPEAYEERVFLVTTPYISFDNRDSFIRPTKGVFSTFAVDISSGLQNSLDNFLRYTFDLRGFYTPYPRLTLAAVGRVGYLTAMGADDDLPQDQLFYLGGTTDVRGFDENLLRFDENGNPVGGLLALSTSLEARYDLGSNYELAVFVDGGSLQDAPEDSAGQDDWRWSVGLGLRYITPIGPIGLLYGYKLDPREGEDRGQFHFSIGYTF